MIIRGEEPGSYFTHEFVFTNHKTVMMMMIWMAIIKDNNNNVWKLLGQRIKSLIVWQFIRVILRLPLGECGLSKNNRLVSEVDTERMSDKTNTRPKINRSFFSNDSRLMVILKLKNCASETTNHSLTGKGNDNKRINYE